MHVPATCCAGRLHPARVNLRAVEKLVMPPGLAGGLIEQIS